MIKILDINREILSLGFHDPALFRVLRGGIDIDDVKEKERRYLQLVLNQIKIIWSAYKLGFYDHDEWLSTRNDIVNLFGLESMRSHWEKVKVFYPRDFREFVSHLLRFQKPQPIPPQSSSNTS